MVKESPSNLPFVEHWRRAVLASDLPIGTKIAAFGFAIHMNGDGSSSRAGPARIALETRLHPTTIIRARRALEKAGWLILVTQGGSEKGGRRTPSEYRGAISTGYFPVPGAESTGVSKLPKTGGREFPRPGAPAPPKEVRERKAKEEGTASSAFCKNCERGWLETPDGTFTRCACLGGPIPSSSNDTDTLLENIDELIAPPPPGLTRRTREAPPF